MCAKEKPSAEAEIIRVGKPAVRERFNRDAFCPEMPGYRARNPGGDPLSRIVLNSLPKSEQWLKNPRDLRL